ncbi:MAG: hypothetical protein EPO21_22080 [Chloroflexota bacterium]|nr:MAG: hypothetical protein EPO21_22080 [Chloroflexota bacterium]
MAQITYQVTLSTDDGKFAVTAQTGDPQSVKRALAGARQIYDELTGEPQSKPKEQIQEDIPVCPEHNQPMVKQRGKYGTFWSCHQKNADGGWCTYKAQ